MGGMNRAQEQELVDAMSEAHRLRAALEAAERECEHWMTLHTEGQSVIVAVKAERDALKERAEAAEDKLNASRRTCSACWEARERMHEAEDRAVALREQVEAARGVVDDYVTGRSFMTLDNWCVLRDSLAAALARLDQQETAEGLAEDGAPL